MLTNVSEHLQGLLQNAPTQTPIRLHILLRQDLGADAVQTMVEHLKAMGSPSSSIELLPHSRIVLVETSLGLVEAIAYLPGVFWIDINHEAPIETLLDKRS